MNLFRNKRVLITGHTGFKGSWLGLWMSELGAEVLGYALPPEREQDHFNLLNLAGMIDHVEGDIRDATRLKAEFQRFQPEFVFHLAAQPLVRLSYRDPETTYSTNVIGSMNVLEAVRETSSVKSVIFVTSDKCYKNKSWIWGYRENDELGGHDPYSASKAAAELVFSSYQDSFFFANPELGAATVRAGNVIGGGDWSEDRIMTDCIKALSGNQPIELRNPNATRPWQHVLEPLFGYMALAARLYQNPENFSGAWNFGPKSESMRSVQNLAEHVVRYWGAGEIKMNIDSAAPHEAHLLHLNCDKANQVLEWLPCWDFQQAIKETVLWYKNYFDGNSVLEFSKRQIAEYSRLQGEKL